MKNSMIILLMFLILGCTTSKEKDKIIEVSLSKMEIKADGKDESEISVKIYEEDGTELKEEKYELYINGEKTEKTVFKTEKAGEYRIKAVSDKYESKEIILKAYWEEEKIILSADKYEIDGDGKDRANFTVEIYDKQGNKMEDVEYKMFSVPYQLVGCGIIDEVDKNYFSSKELDMHFIWVEINIEGKKIESNIMEINVKSVIKEIKMETDKYTIKIDFDNNSKLIITGIDKDNKLIENFEENFNFLEYKVWKDGELLENFEYKELLRTKRIFTTNVEGEYKIEVSLRTNYYYNEYIFSNKITIKALK